MIISAWFTDFSQLRENHLTCFDLHARGIQQGRRQSSLRTETALKLARRAQVSLIFLMVPENRHT